MSNDKRTYNRGNIPKCNVCGNYFEKPSSDGIIVCPECKGDKEKALNRVYTKDTVNLICIYYEQGDSIEKICRVLGRSEANVIKALKIGGKVM